MICIDTMYNPQRMRQILGRIQRIGSEHKKVNYIHLISTGTIEEKMEYLLASRQALTDNILNEDSELFNKLTPEQLVSFLKE